MHHALQILGFKSYHMVEAVKNGFPDVRFLNEAADAAWYGKGRRFTRGDFDKWLGNYDASSIFPSVSLSHRKSAS